MAAVVDNLAGIVVAMLFVSLPYLAYHPKIVPVLVYERFTGFGLAAAQPVALVLLLTVLWCSGCCGC